MPSRTTVYGVGVAAGVVFGAAAALLLGNAERRRRVAALVRRDTERQQGPTHILLPDVGDDDGGLGAAVEEGISVGRTAVEPPVPVGQTA